MLVEARVTTVVDLEGVLALPVDSIGIGQEGCVFKLPDVLSLRRAAERIRSAGRSVTVVLPMAWQRSAAQIVSSALAVASDGPTTLTVNDPGSLIALAGVVPDHSRLAAGVALTRRRAHLPVDGTAAPGEAALDVAGLNALASYGVSVAELDGVSELQSAALPGWRLRHLVGITPLGWGRSCATARHHRIDPPDCTPCCDQAITITATHHWELNRGNLHPLRIVDRNTQPPLTVFGNAVYRTSPPPFESLTATGHDDIVVDLRFLALSDFRAWLAARRPT